MSSRPTWCSGQRSATNALAIRTNQRGPHRSMRQPSPIAFHEPQFHALPPPHSSRNPSNAPAFTSLKPVRCSGSLPGTRRHRTLLAVLSFGMSTDRTPPPSLAQVAGTWEPDQVRCAADLRTATCRFRAVRPSTKLNVCPTTSSLCRHIVAPLYDLENHRLVPSRKESYSL